VASAGLWLMDWPPHLVGCGARREYILNVYTEPEFRGRGVISADGNRHCMVSRKWHRHRGATCKFARSCESLGRKATGSGAFCEGEIMARAYEVSLRSGPADHTGCPPGKRQPHFYLHVSSSNRLRIAIASYHLVCGTQQPISKTPNRDPHEPRPRRVLAF
jgi:hypothetical protein